VGARPLGRSLEGASAHFLQSFKKRVLSRNFDESMLKTRIFGKKTKNLLSVEPPFASGGWGLRPPRCYSRLLLQGRISTLFAVI